MLLCSTEASQESPDGQSLEGWRPHRHQNYTEVQASLKAIMAWIEACTVVPRGSNLHLCLAFEPEANFGMSVRATRLQGQHTPAPHLPCFSLFLLPIPSRPYSPPVLLGSTEQDTTTCCWSPVNRCPQATCYWPESMPHALVGCTGQRSAIRHRAHHQLVQTAPKAHAAPSCRVVDQAAQCVGGGGRRPVAGKASLYSYAFASVRPTIFSVSIRVK